MLSVRPDTRGFKKHEILWPRPRPRTINIPRWCVTYKHERIHRFKGLDDKRSAKTKLITKRVCHLIRLSSQHVSQRVMRAFHVPQSFNASVSYHHICYVRVLPSRVQCSQKWPPRAQCVFSFRFIFISASHTRPPIREEQNIKRAASGQDKENEPSERTVKQFVSNPPKAIDNLLCCRWHISRLWLSEKRRQSAHRNVNSS